MVVLLLYVRLIETSPIDEILFLLADQNSYELVKLNSSDESPSLRLLPRFKQPASDGMSCSISFFFRVCVCFVLVVDVYTCEISSVLFFFLSLSEGFFFFFSLLY